MKISMDKLKISNFIMLMLWHKFNSTVTMTQDASNVIVLEIVKFV